MTRPSHNAHPHNADPVTPTMQSKESNEAMGETRTLNPVQDLADFAKDRRFATVMADPPWRFISCDL